MTILPTYDCNLHCDFCFFNMYRDKKDRKHKLLDLDKFEEFLKCHPDITELIIIGGEPFITPKGYLKQLIDICYNHIHRKIDVYTNFTLAPPEDLDYEKTHIIVGYDPCNRKKQTKVLSNMLSFQEHYSVSMIITKEFIEQYGAEWLVNFAKKIKKKIHICNYEIVPGNEWSHRPSPEEFAKFVIELGQYDCKYLSFKGLNAFNKIEYEDTKSHRFETHIMMTPMMTFTYQTSGVRKPHRVNDSYENAQENFYKTYKPNQICTSCKYNLYCGKMYAQNNKCEYDRIVMDLFEEEHRRRADGYYTNLQM